MSTPIPAPLPTTREPQFSFGGYTGQPGALTGVTFGPRFLARIIDFAIHFVIALISGVVLGIMVAIAVSAAGGNVSQVSHRMFGGEVGFVAQLFAVVGAAVFSLVCEAVHGSTPGKLLLGMVVLQEDGTPCGWKGATIRELGYFVDALFFGIVGYYAMKGSPLHQRNGDKWADTIVVKRADAPSGSLRSGGRFVGALLLAAMADSIFLSTPYVMKLF